MSVIVSKVIIFLQVVQMFAQLLKRCFSSQLGILDTILSEPS